ncbi:hypothetical protein H1R17_02360 [Flavobacterium sp. xlx-214]|uniref:hypothetical protein n=1 Tax=unclassified Flavobacterium TaxID=196869 RepID=UPI0013D01FCF|nr:MULTISPECIES: hypothetical protein [unclassified Flavobacterium]MBA5794093.1 hypothetical protein [Flavobacterium sp. xlx-221]QMI84002.1 hypothetical protein H1R17_02360 [Flavobacterium sp. xlx-214]
MNEIITALQNWNAIRKDAGALISFFNNLEGFKLDMSLFPVGVPLHAYPAIKDNALYFVVISEDYDVESPSDELEQHCFWMECKESLMNSQEITEEDALSRIDTWLNTKIEWINDITQTDLGIYQNFFIPTYDLLPQTYKANFALKDGLNPSLKAADLVLKSQSNLFFDTIIGEPPFIDRKKYYILDLL